MQRLLACRSPLIWHWSLWSRRWWSDVCRRRWSNLLGLRLLHLIGWSDSSRRNFLLFFGLLCRIEDLWSIRRSLIETLKTSYVSIWNHMLICLDWDRRASYWCLMNWDVWWELLVLRRGHDRWSWLE